MIDSSNPISVAELGRVGQSGSGRVKEAGEVAGVGENHRSRKAEQLVL